MEQGRGIRSATATRSIRCRFTSRASSLLSFVALPDFHVRVGAHFADEEHLAQSSRRGRPVEVQQDGSSCSSR